MPLVPGDGRRIRFWIDKWIGDSVLSVSFPNLFSIANDKEASISALLQPENDSYSWDIRFTRNFQDWEMEVVEFFMALIYSHVPKGDEVDRLALPWLCSFSIKSLLIKKKNGGRV